MPVINIREIDNSQAGAVALDDYSVFIPGNASSVRINAEKDPLELNKVYKFTTLTDFLDTVGTQAVVYSDGNETPYLDKDGNTQDVGYLTARLLLSRGMKVLYKVPCNITVGQVDTTGVTPVAIEKDGTAQDIVLVDTTYTLPLPEDVKVVLDTEVVNELTGDQIAYVNYTHYTGYTFYDTTEQHSLTTMSSEDLGTFKTNGSVEIESVTYDHFVFNGGYYANSTSSEVTLSQITTYAGMKEALSKDTFYEELKDQGLHSPYFLTTGGYFSVDLEAKQDTIPSAISTIQTIAKTRGDCVALVDHVWNANKRDLLTIAARVSDGYSIMYTPWCKYEISTYQIILPPSVAYLEAFGQGTINNPMWYAMAGATRGEISGTPIKNYGEEFANTLQPEVGVSINPITQINPYGIRIWGNRTLKTNSGLVASSFLNIRMLCCQLKKQLYISAKGQMFEQNSDRLWVNFKSQIDTILVAMVSGNGIKGYKINKLPSTKKGQIKAHVKIVPIEGLENVDILLELADNLVSVEVVE